MGLITFDNICQRTENAKWHQYRSTGLGASSVATILGYDEYKCNLELFYEKIGYPTFDLDSLPMLIGRETEDWIAKLWSHWNGSEKSIVENYNAGIVVRECEPVNAFARNSDFPWLFASLDRFILPNKMFNSKGALELKNTQAYVLKKWENGVVPGHLIQNLVQIFLPELLYGEIAYYYDNKKFDLAPLHDITPYTELIENIKNETKLFWDSVIIGRGFYTRRQEYERKFNSRMVGQMDLEIARIEPPMQNTPRYLAFMSERFKNRTAAGEKSMKGSHELYLSAKRHRDLKMQVDELQKSIRMEEIILKDAIGPNHRMEFGKGEGYVSWAVSSNNARPFLNKVI